MKILNTFAFKIGDRIKFTKEFMEFFYPGIHGPGRAIYLINEIKQMRKSVKKVNPNCKKGHIYLYIYDITHGNNNNSKINEITFYLYPNNTLAYGSEFKGKVFKGKVFERVK